MKVAFRRVAVAMMAAVWACSVGIAQAAAPDWLQVDRHAPLIVMGGTDDPAAEDQLERVAHWVDAQQIQTVSYMASFGPLVGDQSYDTSVEDGKAHLREFLANWQSNEKTTIVSMSQGGRVLGDFAKEIDTPDNADKIRIISMSDPRDPHRGFESRMQGAAVPGVTATGPREPTQYVEYISVCIEGDPVCADVKDPAAAAFGFYCTHAGGCKGIDYHYGNLHNLEVRSSHTVGATTYVMMKAPSPAEQIAGSLGGQVELPYQVQAAMNSFVLQP